MKLLQETSSNRLEVLTESTATGKKLYLEGPFLMAEALNRNQRRYPRQVLEKAVAKYQTEYISERRALGELQHPDYPFPDPKVAAIITKSLVWQGNDVIGKAQVLDSFYGQQIRALLDADFNLGVSSRGLGEVLDHADGTADVTEFLLNAIDAVDLPSGQVCYVKPVNESTSWVERNGIWVMEAAKKQPGAKPERLLEAMDELFKQFAKGEKA